jgi:hypothetical protein
VASGRHGLIVKLFDTAGVVLPPIRRAYRQPAIEAILIFVLSIATGK